MARKKKVTKKSTEQQITATQSHPLAYQGKVKIQVAHGAKILSSKTYTNNGLPNLFKYISHALAGSYYPSLRPCKIKVLRYTQAEESDAKTPTTFSWETDKQNLVDVSPYIAYDATPVAKRTETGYATVFRFKIPFNWLFARTFNTIGLYSEANDECAYFLFTKAGTDATSREWDTQNLGDVVGNYSLIIEWTMEVSNKD